MQGMFRRFNARELVVDKGEKESRGNNFSLKFHFALVEEHPLDIHAAIRIIANFFALDVSHNKPREYVFSVTLTRYEAGQWTTNEKNIYIFFLEAVHAFLFTDFSWIFHDARWKIYAIDRNRADKGWVFRAICAREERWWLVISFLHCSIFFIFIMYRNYFLNSSNIVAFDTRSFMIYFYNLYNSYNN